MLKKTPGVKYAFPTNVHIQPCLETSAIFIDSFKLLFYTIHKFNTLVRRFILNVIDHMVRYKPIDL